LAGLTNLEGLDLDDNSISDISPLAGLPKLSTVWLKGNELNSDAHTIHIPALEANDISANYDPIPLPALEDNGIVVAWIIKEEALS